MFLIIFLPIRMSSLLGCRHTATQFLDNRIKLIFDRDKWKELEFLG